MCHIDQQQIGIILSLLLWTGGRIVDLPYFPHHSSKQKRKRRRTTTYQTPINLREFIKNPFTLPRLVRQNIMVSRPESSRCVSKHSCCCWSLDWISGGHLTIFKNTANTSQWLHGHIRPCVRPHVCLLSTMKSCNLQKAVGKYYL